MLALSLYRDEPDSEEIYRRFEAEEVLARLRVLDRRAERKGLAALDPARNKLIGLGMEIDAEGRVTRNGYGVFNLAWRAEHDGNWPERVAAELEEMRRAIRDTHGVPLKYVIWAGMGGSSEDKAMYLAAGLLNRGPRLYVLDSTDPAKLKAILAGIERRGGAPLRRALASTLVVGMALGMTSYEPVVNLEKLASLYARYDIDPRPNFLYLTLPGSLLDQFAHPHGFRRVDLQLDGAHSTAGRHSAPLTRGSLYPLGLAGVDLRDWIEGTFLQPEEIHAAFRLAAFLEGQAGAGRDKVTLLLPKSWRGAATWTKQDFEESLGKSEQAGIKIVIEEKPKLANYHPAKDPRQDRAFVVVQRKGEALAERQKVALVRRLGYPVAAVSVGAGAPLSAFMQFVHYAVFGLAYLRQMNFVTQPGVELYKAITNRLYQESVAAGGVRATPAWAQLTAPAVAFRQRGLTLCCPHVQVDPAWRAGGPAAVYAGLIREFVSTRQVEYAELTFFGDTRYNAAGRRVRKTLDRAAEQVFRAPLKMAVDVYEGPAMNHSFHEMIIGHGRCFSTVLMPARPDSIPSAGYTADYHMAQFLATQLALAERGRPVVALLLDDLEERSLQVLEAFFRDVGRRLRRDGTGKA